MIFYIIISKNLSLLKKREVSIKPLILFHVNILFEAELNTVVFVVYNGSSCLEKLEI
jgi:hypothetical protein